MQDDEHKGLKNTAFIIALIVIFAGVYVTYRYWKNPSITALKNITNIAALPATSCTVSGGSFEGGANGTVLIAHGRMSEVIKVQTGSDSKVMHILISDADNGTMQSWLDGETQGVFWTNIYAKGPLSVPDNTGNCGPMWNPDPSPFQVPVEVTFNPAQ